MFLTMPEDRVVGVAALLLRHRELGRTPFSTGIADSATAGRNV